MWSASRVAELKASLQQPGVKFTKLQAEPKAKVYTAGQSIGLEHDDPLTIQTTLNNINDNNNNNNATTNDDDKDVITLEQKNVLSNALSSSTPTTTTSTTKTNNSFMNNTTKIVLDSGAFISGTNLTSYGPDCEYYTLQEVIDELRDEQAKFNFHTFPYPITVKEPSSLSMAYITNISKQTGDFYVLSFVDRKVLALCHQLEVETNGDKYIHYQVQRVELNNNNKNNMSTTDIEAKAKKDIKNVTQQQQQKQKQNNQKTATTESTTAESTTTATTTTTITPTDPRAWVNEFVANDFDIALLLSDMSDDYNNDINQIGQDSPQQQQEQQQKQEEEEEKKQQQKTIEGYTIFPSTFETFIPTLGNSSTQQLRVQRQHAGKFILPGFDDGNWVTQGNMQTLQEKSSRSSTISLSATTKASALGANHLLPAATITATDINISSKTNNKNKMTMTVKDSQKQVQQQNDEKKKQQQNNNNNNNNNNQKQQQQRTLVGGITTDYSMQNVMLQAGLQCLTIDGRAITTIRQYIMGCHACFTLSKDMSRGFCPTCGGFTMVRIIVNVDARGRPHYQWPINRINNTRGTIFQISKKAQFGVKGKGKIILREDMLPKPKLKEVLIARGERAAPTEETTFNDAALFATMRNFDAKNVTYGYGNRNMNISRKRRR